MPDQPILLAVWFLDDGHCRKDCVGGRIAKDGFSLKEVTLLKLFIQQTQGINTKLVKFLHNSKTRYYISIGSKNFLKFISLIKHTVLNIPSLMYKIKKPYKI